MRPTLLTLFRSLRVSCLLAGFVLVSTLPIHAQSRPAPLASKPLAKRVRGEEALQALGNRLRDVAEFHRMSEDGLRQLFRRDKSLWVDQRGRLFYVCEFGPSPQQGPTGESTNTPPLNPLYQLNQTFKLHNRPGANRIIYLDFDGHDASTTTWGADNVPLARPYDTDGSPYTFGNTERSAIQYIWSRVAEDFLQYDIDVTTEDPGVAALKNAGTGRYGVRVVIGGAFDDWFESSAGGVARLFSFTDSTDVPCWVFPKNLGPDDEKDIAEASSHEAGHTLGLLHDGQTTGVEYYAGHGDWAPIMGVGYDRPVSQWSQGEYSSANNGEDDLAKMLTAGAVSRPDDHGDDMGSATPLVGIRPFRWGIISSRTDVDFFSFAAGAGRTTITCTPAPRGPNLRIELSLYDGNGSLIISSNVADNSTSGTQPVTISQILPAGTYFVSVDGVGVGSPVNTGYSDYASLGQFTLSVTLPGDGTWATTSGGSYSWTDPANWSSATYPLALSATARLNNNIAGDQSIQIDTPVTIGRLLIGDADSSHTFTLQASGAGVLRLGTTNDSAWIGKFSGLNDTIAVPLVLQTNLLVTNTTLSDLLIASNVDGPFTMTKYGVGRLLLGGACSPSQLFIAEGTVVLGNSTSVAAVGAITIGSNAVFDVSAAPGGWPLAAARTLSGQGTVTGDVAAASSSRLAPGVSNAPGTMTFSDQLTLNDGAQLVFDLGSVTNLGVGINDLLAVSGNLSLSGQISVEFDLGGGLPDTNGTYTILTYGGMLTGSAANFTAANAGRRFTYVFDDSVVGEIRVHVSGAPESLTWAGDGIANDWDVAGATNWLRGGTPDAFFQGDTLLFDTGSASPAVNLTGSLLPASLTVSNSANFTFTGSGQISGNTALTKLGSGVLTLATSNSFSGVALIQDGTVSIGNVAALGLTNSGTTVTNTGQLNLSGTAIGFERLTVSGAGPAGDGAVINTGASQSYALRNLTLAGNTTIGGTTRWDIRGVPASNITANLNGNGFALTKTGSNQIWLANLGSFVLGNITVNQGTLGFEGANAIAANSANLTVNAGATLAFLNSFDSDFNKAIVLNSATVQSDSGHNNLIGAITLSGTNITSVGEAATLDLRGTVLGSGGFSKTGPGILRLAGGNSFSGNLIVSAGTVMAGHNAALGTTAGTTTITSGGRLDVAAFNLGAEQIFVAGSGINGRGAIVNSLPTPQQNALRFVTLTDNTTFGGNTRWDIRGNPTGSLLGAFSITKVGVSEVWLASLDTTAIANISITEGVLGFQGTTTMGNSASSISVTSGGAWGIYATGTNILAKMASLSTGRITNGSGSNTFSGTVSLSGSNHIDVVGGSTLVLGGALSGAGFFNKASAGTLVLAGANTASGASRVSSGALHIGAGGLSGSLTGVLTNNATLIFNRALDLTHSAVIAGVGTLTKQNTNTLTLSAANTYSGSTTISAGTLRVGNATALGGTTGGTTVGDGATLDVNGFSLGTESVIAVGAGVGSAGAVVNNGVSQTNALRSLVLGGDTSLGGINRWDLRGISGVGMLSTLVAPSVLTKAGPNTIGLADVDVNIWIGDVLIQQGVLSLERGTTGLGDPTATVTVYSNATLNLYSLSNALNKVIVLENASKLSHSGPVAGGVNSAVSGPITLSGGNAFVENSSPLYSLQISNTVTGTGGFVKTGAGLVQLNSVNNYDGNTTVALGTLKLGPAATLNSTPLISVANSASLDVSSLGGGFVLGPAQVLAGNGTVSGNVMANGTISPGTSVGRLTISGNATLAGIISMELNKAGAILTNDVLSVGGMLACGGTLAVTHSGNTLAANDSFRLLSAGTITGSFANYSLPALGQGLAWDTSTINSDGWLRVVSNAFPVISNASIINGEIVVTGSGGSPGSTYYVVTTTNVALPVVQWLPVATNTFDAGGNFVFTNTVSLVELQQFFRLRVP